MMGYARMGVAVGCVMALTACNKVRDYGREAIEQRAEELARADAEASAEPVAASAPTPQTITARAGYAVFKGDQLDECTDLSVRVPFEVGAEKPSEAVAEMRAKAMPKDAVHVESCAEPFADRVVLGSCVDEATIDRDAGVVTLRVESRYFRAATTKDSDVHMRSCLKSGGKWSAPAADDFDAARERLRQRANSLQRLAGQ